MRANRKYDSEFEREAVLLFVEQGLTIREVEKNLGITYGVLKGWVQKYRDNREKDREAIRGVLNNEISVKILLLMS